MFCFMKKIVYLCTLVLLSLNVMAQIDLNDRNWDTVFYDDFSSVRSWDPISWNCVPDQKWNATCLGKIVHGYKHEHQIYQYQNCQIDTLNKTINLLSEFDRYNRIPAHSYSKPNNVNYPNIYGQNYDENGELWYFFSGAITTKNLFFHYGYFEIRCSLPVHPGSFPAFWLFSSNTNSSNGYYNEIDIFEYSNSIATMDYYKQYTCGLYCDNEHYNSISHARTNPILPGDAPDLRSYHVFACEWLPYKVTWYVDGNRVNEYSVVDSIPHNPMKIVANYAINRCVFENQNINNQLLWNDSDIMTIDYIKVCSLKLDCEHDETINCQYDMDNFDYSLKKSINITSSIGNVLIRNTDKITFRVTNSFEITGPFTIVSGGDFTVIKQDCF